MIQLTPQMRLLVAAEPVDFRKGIDGLCAVCRQQLDLDPFSGTLFVFVNRSRQAIRMLAYDGQGYWLCHKRLSRGRFVWNFDPARGPGPGTGRPATADCCCGTATPGRSATEEFRPFQKKWIRLKKVLATGKNICYRIVQRLFWKGDSVADLWSRASVRRTFVDPGSGGLTSRI